MIVALPGLFSYLLVQEKKRKIDFEDGGNGGHLRLPIGMILGIFDRQVTLMLPIKFQAIRFRRRSVRI